MEPLQPETLPLQGKTDRRAGGGGSLDKGNLPLGGGAGKGSPRASLGVFPSRWVGERVSPRCQQSAPMTRGCQGNTGRMLSRGLGGQGSAHHASGLTHGHVHSHRPWELSKGSHWAQAEEAAVRRPAPPDSGGPAGAQEALSGRLSESVEVSVAHSSPTHGDPTDRSPPGSSVHGILQARILEWVAIFSSRGSS